MFDGAAAGKSWEEGDDETQGEKYDGNSSTHVLADWHVVVQRYKQPGTDTHQHQTTDLNNTRLQYYHYYGHSGEKLNNTKYI